MRSLFSLLCAALLLAAGCSSSDDVTTAPATAVEATVESSAPATTEPVVEAEPAAAPASDATAAEPEPVAEAAEEAPTEEAAAEEAEAASEAVETAEAPAEPEAFTIEVWADNWMGVHVDGVLIGEDSVSITTERSFNSETFSFEAAYPFTLAIEAKDFKETDSGLEYIGAGNQQMGDGGIIAQVKDSSGAVVWVTTGDLKALVVHQAPLNKDCENSSDPNTECEFLISETPANWTTVGFDDSSWTTATVWDTAAVDPKIGYDDISWDNRALFVWGTDLETDNTVLLRSVVSG